MPILRTKVAPKVSQKKLYKPPDHADKIVRNYFIDWWNDETVFFSLERCQAKFKDLVATYKPRPKYIGEIWESIKAEQFAILSRWYKRHVSDNDTNFTYLYSLVYQDTSIPEVQKDLVELITKWKDDIESRPKPSPLASIALDNQSIHTAPVMKQQNATRAILFAVPVPKGQQTIDEITQAFLERYGWTNPVKGIIKDMMSWGKKSEIVEKDDYLYRKILVHLWAKIQSYKSKDADTYNTLVQRLYEEAYESVGMCAMGHVNRLCNVLCGFVEGIETPRDSKEAFQDLIAKLAAEEKDVEEKKKEALVLMETYGIAEGEREAWLEAL